MKKVLEFQYEIAEIGGEKRRLVNARDLHKQLEIDTRFNDWINRYLLKLGFIQDIDYIVKKFDYSKMSNQKGRGGDRRSETYLVTVETAKHLAMMAKTPKGKEVRNYLSKLKGSTASTWLSNGSWQGRCLTWKAQQIRSA